VSLVVLGATATAAGGTIYVDVDAGGANNGSSWTDAYRYVQDGLAAAWSGDEIRVARGRYVPDQNSANPSGSGDRGATFQLKNGVAVTGGYAGVGETYPDARDIAAYETVLSGDLNVDDAPDFANNGENSYHVVTGSGTDATAVLDGFIITAGNADSSWPNGSGGGIYNNYGSPTLANCTFINNSAREGGGMCNDHSSPMMLNCMFIGNYSSQFSGGGVSNYYGNPVLTNCTFSGNSTDRNGGGMSNSHGGSPTLTNCTFSGNSATDAGGVRMSGNSTLTNCTFISNSADNYGGGMTISEGNPTLTNCRFTNNSAFKGGGIITYAGYPTPILTNCIFNANSAITDGGGFYYGHSEPTLTNCTFVANSAGGDGGGICSFGSENILTVTNCILWSNTADEGPQIALKSILESTVIIDYSCVEGGELDVYTENDPNLDWDENSNIDADPCFVPGRLGDYYLSQTAAGQETNSLCVDAGSDTAANLGVDIFTTRTDQVVDAGTVDMGYHYPITNVADINGDWDVDFVDFAILATQWQQAPSIPSADIEPASGNGIVDFLDLSVLVDNWLWEK
jgi:hypothetical protein